MTKKYSLEVEGREIIISNPEKLLWPEAGISKTVYISCMVELAPYILPYAKGRLLTTIRYPDGIHGQSFYQKSCPEYAPEWVNTAEFNDISYIILDSVPTLVWLATQAALEFHVTFNTADNEDNPTYLVFDLDPSKGQTFDEVIEAGLKIHETLEALSIKSFAKTSGATGLQVYIPVNGRYDYDRARLINEFFGKYFSQKYPDLFTIERIVKNRGKKLYFDYLQMWYGKTLAAAYCPRATEKASISMPIDWDQLPQIKPEDFTLLNAGKLLVEHGDRFKGLLETEQNLDSILERIGAFARS
ncbi:MAG: non-homologous end-joining DNA ligase [Bacillota bacterium]|nr:non-homologous end-joining DNA ligase [Bacillota bacterium]